MLQRGCADVASLAGQHAGGSTRYALPNITCDTATRFLGAPAERASMSRLCRRIVFAVVSACLTGVPAVAWSADKAPAPPAPLLKGLKNPESVAVGVDGRVYV